MKNRIIELSESNFRQEVLDAAQPVLVGFWAVWSEPCRVMARTFASMTSDDGLAIKFAMVNIENCENLTEQCGVETIPTVLLYKEGHLRDRIIGNATELALRESLSSMGGASTQEIQQCQARSAIGAP